MPQPITVNTVALHQNPDLDCIGAYWLATKYPEVFIGIDKAEIEFWPQGPPSDGRSAEELEKDGIICLDVGQGRFDHHPHQEENTQCATDLVAEYLGVCHDITYQRILDYIRMHDLDGPTTLSKELREMDEIPKEFAQRASLLETFSFVSVFSFTKKRYKQSWRSFIEWVGRNLTSFHDQQVYFWTTVKDEFLEKAEIFEIPIQTETGPGKYNVAVIISDVRQVGSFSRTRDGGYCDLCIHKMETNGNVFISSSVLSSKQFMEIAKFLRVWELKIRGIFEKYYLKDLAASEFKLIEREKNAGSSVWYLPKDSKGRVFVIMNGGEKTAGSTEIESTRLNIKQITAAVYRGLNEEIMAEECPHSSCLGKTCGFYPFGLQRCINIRKAVN